ncbi:MAG: YiiD C-terminal domain-containing protein [Wenzhouxiangellaceae bacterium]
MSGVDYAGERAWLEQVLTRRIPLGAAMQLQILRLDARGIALRAPLEPNVNDKGTAFGGALASMMILAGWSLPRLLLRRAGSRAELVIGRSELVFLQPVRGVLVAECEWPPSADCSNFIRTLNERGRARIALRAWINGAEKPAATLDARYAALSTPP